MRYNEGAGVVVSTDESGMIQYWTTDRYQQPGPEEGVQFGLKLDTGARRGGEGGKGSRAFGGVQ